jgi:predicted nucleic acid-binding protein
MKSFFDTSVMIAAFLESDAHHRQSRALLLKMRPETAACSVHSLAEFYSVLTRLPQPLRVRAEHAGLLLQDIRKRVTPIALTVSENLQELQRLVEAGITGGHAYDALLLACARKSHSERIYTLNLKHFRMLAPDLANKIIAP